MIPILFEKTETEFTSNGICRLRDIVSCICTEERNGIYECDFEYPVDGANYELIQVGRIIGVTHDETGDVQPFDIVSYTKPIDGIVTFHAVHISYRLSYCTISPQYCNTLNDAFTVLGSTTPQNHFIWGTDKDSIGYLAAANNVPITARQLMGGIEGSVLDTYGGEWEYDKWTIYLWQNRGTYRDFAIRYGVNMLDYNEEYDSSSVYSSCIPYWTDGTTTIVGDKQTNGGICPSGREQCIPLDVSEKFEDQPTKAQVNAMGLQVMNASNPTVPTQNITVSFVRLQDMGEFADYQNLLQCKLCDTIKVIFPDYNSSGTFKIVKTVWNVLTGKYDEMELGDLSISLSEALGINDIQRDSRSTIEQIQNRLDDEVDFIVESGTSGIWYYRKWDSGRCEAWANKNQGSIAITTNNPAYGGYRSAGLSTALPNGLFNVTPTVIAGKHAAQGGWIANCSATSKTNIETYFGCATSLTITSQHIAFYVFGTWK